jgi:hypothetical protein
MKIFNRLLDAVRRQMTRVHQSARGLAGPKPEWKRKQRNIRTHFTPAQVKRVHKGLCKLSRDLAAVKRDEDMNCVQFSKTPPKHSESLAIHSGPQLLPNARDFVWQSGDADVTCSERIGSAIKPRRVEVKGTRAGFQSFSDRDIKAHYLIWFDFACYRSGRLNDPVTVYVLADPGRHGLRPGRITLKKFLATAGENVRVYQGSVPELADGKVEKVTPGRRTTDRSRSIRAPRAAASATLRHLRRRFATSVSAMYERSEA